VSPLPLGKDITHAALTTIIGNSQGADKVVRHVLDGPSDSGFYVPDPDFLKLGDVILTRPKPAKWRFVEKWLARRTFKLQRGHCPEQHCGWTHSSLYIGHLHVAEANKSWPPKTKVTAITRWNNHDFKVLRWSNPSDFNVEEVIRFALLDQIINPRGYDTARALLASVGIWAPPDHERRLICSEYVLDRLAVGRILVPEKVAVDEQKRYYFPAHFAADSRFVQLDMRFSRLTEVPRSLLRKT
jgi:hypothetical protein